MKHIKRVKKVLTIEENVLMGGFGSTVLEEISAHAIQNVSVQRIGLPDSFIEQGEQDHLRKKYGLDEYSIYQKAIELAGK